MEKEKGTVPFFEVPGKKGTVPFSKRRILFVLPSLAGGGAERAAVQVLNALDPERWDRSMYLFSRTGPYLQDVAPGIPVESSDSASRLGRWRALGRFIAATRPDVVVSFLSYLTVLTAVRASMSGARVVFHVQTPVTAFLDDADYTWGAGWRRRLFVMAARLGFSAADLVIASSRGVAADLTASFGVDPSRVKVVPNPVDIDAVAAAAAEPIGPADEARLGRPLIVAAGRLADAKNYPLLIEAFARLRAQMPVTLVVLGAGEREAELKRFAGNCGVADAIQWMGFQANPWKFMARADVFALTSRYEGFGNVLVEAMACGVPVVATASPGTRDIVRDGVDGALVTRHEPAAVADALGRLLKDAARRGRAAQEAKAGAARFARPVVVSAFDAAFAGALA